jgi:hypothetical protein
MKKRNLSILSVLVLIVFFISFVSAGFFDFLKGKVTGHDVTDTVTLNVSVTSGTPVIWDVRVQSPLTLTLGPNPTYFHVNFSVNDTDGADNLNNVTAAVNISSGVETPRFNTSCAVVNYGGNDANYSCLVTAWWFDDDADWVIGANITDLNSNTGSNTTDTITIGTLTGFEMYPSALAFSTLTPGTYNQTPNNYVSMNNTGNDPFGSGNVQINASDLRGEQSPGYALWAGNFSASPQTGGLIECNITASATQLVNFTYTGITNVILNDGNYTINDGTGQEDMYLCLREVGAELAEQYYSTENLGAWTVQVV